MSFFHALLCVVLSLVFVGQSFSQSSDGDSMSNVADISDFGDFSRPGQETDSTMFFYSVTPTMDTTMTDYQRDSSGQWIYDETGLTNQGDDPSVVTVELQSPADAYRVRLKITIDGVPFRTHQEKGIALAIEQAENPVVKKSAAKQVAGDVSATAGETRVAAKAYRRSDVIKKLAGYVRAQALDTDSAIDRGELQWMVTQWLPGSRFLISEDRFGLQHRSTASLFQMICSDAPAISIANLDHSVDLIVEADRNGDLVVERTELSAHLSNRSERSKSSKPWWNQTTLLTQVDNAKDVDCVVNIDINGESSQWELQNATDSGSATVSRARHVQDTPFGALDVVVVRDDRTTNSFFESGQFSVGAVVMPDPLFAFADTRADNRLDMREINSLPTRIRLLDRDGDGDVSISELPAQIKLVVAQGPWANRLATQLSEMPVVTLAAEPTVTTPSWFAGMDSNRDRLVARDEFLGNDQQFQDWDKDSDGMISSEEASQ